MPRQPPHSTARDCWSAVSLAVGASAVAVEVCSTSGGGGEASLLVAAVTEQGDALVWRCTQGAQGEAASAWTGQHLLQVRGSRCGAEPALLPVSYSCCMSPLWMP